MPKEYIKNLPKIGIRPIIDAREKVRSTLEDSTKKMAHVLAMFLKDNIRYPINGKPIDVIVADTCIGGFAEAAKVAEYFKRENVGAIIDVARSWAYGVETIDLDPTIPKAIWGFNGTERPGAVYLAATAAGYAQKGIPVFTIYGKDVQDAEDFTIPVDVQKKILNFAKAALAIAIMKEKSYLSIGSVSMGIAGSIIEPSFFEEYLGMRVEYVDMTEIIRRIEENIFDPDEFRIALRWVKENCKEGFDRNPPELQQSKEEKDKSWETIIKMTLIIRDLMVGNPKLKDLGFNEESKGHNAIVAGFQGQRHWTDHFPNGDFTEAILNSSFDWNGTRPPYILATENDSLNGVSMLLGFLLTGRAQIFADVRTYWSPEAVERVTGVKLTGIAKDGFLYLSNSGSAALDGTGEQIMDGKPVIKPWWDVSEEDIKKCLKATSWCPAIREYFKGGGFSSHFITRGGMPATMFRINIIESLGPTLQIAEGYTIDLPENVSKIINERTDPTWPITYFVPILTGKGPFKDVYSVMNNWGANHCVLSYGHIGDELITLSSMLRIPVCMHNVSEDRIFRPHTWTFFGMNFEEADFRACKSFGPIYKKST